MVIVSNFSQVADTILIVTSKYSPMADASITVIVSKYSPMGDIIIMATVSEYKEVNK